MNYGFQLAILSSFLLTIAHFVTRLESKNVHPVKITAINAVICATFVFSYAVVKGFSFIVSREELLYVGIHSIGHALCNILFFLSLSKIPSYDAVTIGAVSPIFGAVFAWLWLGEKLSILDIVYIVAVMIGLIFVCQPSFIFGMPNEHHVLHIDRFNGSLFATIAAVCWAITCCSNRKIIKTHIFIMEFYVFIAILISSLILLGTMNKLEIPKIKGDIVWIIIISAAFLGGHAINCRALQLEEVCRIGVVKNSESVFMLIIQWTVLGELPTVVGFVGSVIVLIAVVSFSLKNRELEKTETLKKLDECDSI
ncbi:Uncharacterised protein g248 [Pycnogonum litorale]